MQQRFLLQILLLAQHVSGTIMPIIRSSRVLYSGCCLAFYFHLLTTMHGQNHVKFGTIMCIKYQYAVNTEVKIVSC